jgi:hypothetical protein
MEALFVAKTRGKYRIEVFKKNGYYEIMELTNGKCDGFASINTIESVIEKVKKILADSKTYDNINYIIEYNNLYN